MRIGSWILVGLVALIAPRWVSSETIRFGEVDAQSKRAAAANNRTISASELAAAAEELTADLGRSADSVAQGISLDTASLSKDVGAFLDVFREYEIDSWGQYLSDADVSQMYADVQGAFASFSNSVRNGYSSLNESSLVELERDLRDVLVGGSVSEQSLRNLMRNLEQFTKELQDEARSLAGRGAGNGRGK
ncbi:MAG: hypothetical protein IT290_03795 [Deltaproteobacteria bacterium]|nr:hypothetical protein [Deltaproteobacteria bacterium]